LGAIGGSITDSRVVARRVDRRRVARRLIIHFQMSKTKF
jgi:hypothetical protein